jgi:ElaB/YqjD/DUF883 family membrane-anchored ribosome-binding protein
MDTINRTADSAAAEAARGMDRVREKANTAVEKGRAMVESARESLGRVPEKAADAARATDECIRDHPYQSIGIAFAVGLLIGVLINRRS